MAEQRISRPERVVNITGRRFGRLVAIQEISPQLSPSGKPFPIWECICDCGKMVTIRKTHLVSGHTRSCGCRKSKAISLAQKTHGMTHTPIYNTWILMRRRCNDKQDNAYKNYGGRGIKVCERWNKFENFLADMGPIYKPGLTIERRNNNGDYCPENCCWATRDEQAVNTRRNHLFTCGGKTQPLSIWAREFHAQHTTILARLRRGWSIERAITEPVHK